MRLIKQLIGGTTLVLVAILFVGTDILGRLVIAPMVRLRPAARVRILGAWAHAIARIVLGLLHSVGRARFDIRPRIRSREGVLMVMNHQSILDIPVAAACVSGGCPRMVAHVRYGKGIPLVSHMISLYGHITVQPGRMGRSEIEQLRDAARTSALPILVFPEGHRTRDGELRSWKRGALDAFLSARAWTVHVVVLDGLWQAARIPDFVRNLSGVRCRVESAGEFEYDGRGRESHDEFVEHLRRVMCDKLAEMRARPGAGDAAPAKESAAGAANAT